MIVTPVKVEKLAEWLEKSNYDRQETEFLLDSFSSGFDIGYTGPKERASTSDNIPFTVGNMIELWNKVMKEVQAGRYAGPYDEIPFDNFIQSPIGLVAKKGGKTRLIFHLSFKFMKESDGKSVNSCIPKECCMVKYHDLDTAVKNCILMAEKAEFVNGTPVIYIGKTDL